MKVARYPIKISDKKSTLILGSFESIHYGHMSLIEEAKKKKQIITLLMIENPTNIPGKKSSEYCAFETRLQQVANLGIDQVVVLTFNDEVKNMEGEKFFESLVKLANATHVVVGKDFAMGHNRTLTAEKIKTIFENTSIVEPIKFNDVKLSTTTLKELVEVGQVDVVKKLSPFSYTITTRVSNEKTFDITTTLPHKGIYAAFAIVNDIKYWCMVKVGFDNNEIIIPDLQIKNSGFDTRIEMRKQIRTIIRKEQDIILDSDREKAILYLQNNQ